MTIRLIVLLTGLLVAGLAQAVDEDYYIPYTDTYGYVYDPETGKFVKEEPKPVPEQSSAAGDSTKAVTGGHAAQSAPSIVVKESLGSEVGTTPFIWISGGGLLLIAGLLYWFRQKRRNAVLD